MCTVVCVSAFPICSRMRLLVHSDSRGFSTIRLTPSGPCYDPSRSRWGFRAPTDTPTKRARLEAEGMDRAALLSILTTEAQKFKSTKQNL